MRDARDSGRLRQASASMRREPNQWIWSRSMDLFAFGGSVLIALALTGVGAALDLLATMPEWLWIAAVLGVDVAHVHSTWFRIYLEPTEFRRRPILFIVVPLICLAVGIVLHLHSSRLFWTVLAYLAVFHFVRQQAGWMAIYRGRTGVHRRLDATIDDLAIYSATLWPLVWWHTHGPRRFAWFVPDDFHFWPNVDVARWTFPLYLLALALFFVRWIDVFLREGHPAWGRALVLASTAVAWYLGIVAFDSDYVFTVTNVLPHGIPYIIMIWFYVKRIPPGERATPSATLWQAGPLAFAGVLFLLAFVEEMLWDMSIWHDRPWLFGPSIDPGALKVLIVPLLSLPQATHYVLDGFIWRRRSNPELRRQVESQPAPGVPHPPSLGARRGD